ncbi:MAG: hypothetical protein Q9193_002320 [Seirophora villosa]
MFPLLHLTPSEFQHLLTTTSLTSQDLTLQYLSQISSHNPAGAFLNTIISTPSEAQVLDIANVMNVLMDEQLQLRLGESWKGVKIGLVDLREWWLPEPYLESEPQSYQEQVLTAVEEVMATIEEKGAQVFRSIPLITMPEFEKDIPDTQGLHDVMTHPFRKAFEDFLSLFPDCPATTLKEVIKSNDEHAYLELPKESPDQDLLVMAEQHSIKPKSSSALNGL